MATPTKSVFLHLMDEIEFAAPAAAALAVADDRPARVLVIDVGTATVRAAVVEHVDGVIDDILRLGLGTTRAQRRGANLLDLRGSYRQFLRAHAHRRAHPRS